MPPSLEPMQRSVPPSLLNVGTGLLAGGAAAGRMIVRVIAIVAPLLATSAATAQVVEVVDEPVRVELVDAACAPGVCTCTGEVRPEGRLAAYGLSARSLQIGLRCIAADLDGDDTIDVVPQAPARRDDS